MLKYLKKFQTHNEYDTYINGEDAALPNVSYCVAQRDVHYNPYVEIERKIIAIVNATSITSPTSIMYSTSTDKFSEIEIDGVVQPSVTDTYTFSNWGGHTVKYTLVDDTKVPINAFYFCEQVVEVRVQDTATIIETNAFANTGIVDITIPNSITTINSNAFSNCEHLHDLTIPNSVTSIANGGFYHCTNIENVTIGNGITNIGWLAFADCSNITRMTINATTPPTLSAGQSPTPATDTFSGSYPIYVPSESVNAYKTADKWSVIASRIQAIP